MSKFTIDAIFAFPLAFFGIATFVIGLVAIALAPFIIDRADYFFGSLNQKGEILFKGYPLSFGRMGRYGLILIFANIRFVKANFFKSCQSKVKDVRDAPKWLRNLMIWIYGGFGICAALASIFGLGFLLVDSL